MWPSSDNQNPQPANTDRQPQATNAEAPGAPARAAHAATQNQHSLIGKSIVIKGEITAADPVYVYGRVEGLIDAPAHRVTVGREGDVQADINAREVVIMGAVCGNLNSSERVEIRCDGSLTGDLTTRRIYVEDGAVLSGAIHVSRPAEVKTSEAQQESDSVIELRRATETEPDVERETWADLAVSEIA